jgi:hypothetical protein
MKKVKFIIASLFLIVFALSCEKDGGDSVVATEESATPNIQKVDGTDGFIDLVAVNDGTPINIGFTVDKGFGNIVSADVVMFYFSGTNVYKAVFATDVTTFPTSFNFSQADIFAAFNEINDATDLAVGDVLKITAELTLADGRVIKILNDDGTANYGSDIANSPVYSVLQNYNVSCPSDLAGTYNVLTTATSTDPGPSASENPIANFPYTVTITANGGGNYTVSDAFGGVYILWYDIYGLDFDVEGTFDDVCGTISGTFPEPFGTDVTFTGTVNPDGTLSIHWINGYDDEGDSVYTKVN